MKIGFCLFKYFPYGGLQRDFMDVALRCQADGHEIYVYTLDWQGVQPDGFHINVIETRALSNHAKYAQYHQQMMDCSQQDQLDCLVGFNKMPGLNIYFASDPCYRARPHNWLQRLSPRYRHFLQFEQAVFAPASTTHILTLATAQQQEYQQAWQTDDGRFTLLTPGISMNAMATDDATELRHRVRQEFAVGDEEFLLLMVGSGFRTKGLDRALNALAALPDQLQQQVKLVAIGQDKPDSFVKMAADMGLNQQVRILPGRDDIAAVMQAGDCLLHPAHREVAGKVILEAVVGGLPVLVSDVCGYAHYVADADAGYVFATPFDQQDFNAHLVKVLQDTDLRQGFRKNGIAYGQQQDLYSMADTAARVIQERCGSGDH